MTKLTDYVTVTEAARILGCSPNTARKWGERGDIPMRRNPANKYRLYRRADLDAFLKKLAKPVSSAKKKPK